MSNFLNKFKPILLPLIRYIVIVILIGFLFFVLTFWYIYVFETSWGFNRLADWWIYVISIIILLPWELLWGLRKTNAYSKIMGNFGVIQKFLLHNKNKVTSALTEKEFLKRLRNASLALILFILFAEEYVVREFSTTSELLSMWYSASRSLKSTFFNIITHISTFDAIRPSYELRGFVFYIVGLIILRQGIRYIFSTWIKKIEMAATQKIDDIYNEPNITKLISYSILTLIVLVFISFMLGQRSESLTIVSPLEKNKALNYPNAIPIVYSFEKTETISATLIINDFDMITSKLTGNLTLVEKQHPYNEGGCSEDYFTVKCDDPSVFPHLFYNDKNIIVNGKQLPVSISNNTAMSMTITIYRIKGNNIGLNLFKKLDIIFSLST